MELNFVMVDVSLVVFEAPNQIGEIHLRAYASGLLHEELKNIKAFVRLRLACLSAEVSVVPVLAQPHQCLSEPSCAAGAVRPWGGFYLLAVLPLTAHENLSCVRLFAWVASLAAGTSQPGALCLCCWELRPPSRAAMPGASLLLSRHWVGGQLSARKQALRQLANRAVCPSLAIL